MNNPLRTFQLFCILLVIGLAAGCGNDDATPVAPVIDMQAGTIGVYGNPDGSLGKIIDRDGTMAVYVVHTVENGATASNFRVQAPAGWTLLTAQSQYPVTIGDVDEGISIAYGQCKSGAIHVMTLTYESLATTPDEAMFRVLPHTLWPNGIQVVDCNFNVLENGRGMESRLEVITPMENAGGNQDRKRPIEE